MIKARLKEGGVTSPSLLAFDTQSVKTVQFVSESVGINGNKKINGRKRTLLVDKLGLPFAIKITTANISDNQVGIATLEQLKGQVPCLEKIATDSGYKGTFITQAQEAYHWKVEIAQNQKAHKILSLKKTDGK